MIDEINRKRIEAMHFARAAKTVIGIDPDCKASGVAVYSRPMKQFQLLACYPQPELESMARGYDRETTLFVVEAGWLNKGIWHGKNTAGWDGKKAMAYGAAIGKSVGANHEIGRQIITFLRSEGFTVEEFKPKRQKWKAADFKRYTGLEKGYNPEIRDAVRAMFSYI